VICRCALLNLASVSTPLRQRRSGASLQTQQ
jgi:hypothetical protein